MTRDEANAYIADLSVAEKLLLNAFLRSLTKKHGQEETATYDNEQLTIDVRECLDTITDGERKS